MGLHFSADGAGDRVVLVHGFTQTSASWKHMASRLRSDHEVVSVDAPGHGGSGATRSDLTAGASLLVDVGGRAVYVGYSMGARLCLRAALDYPDAIGALVLIGATAGIDDPAERAQRRRCDNELAERIEAIGVEAFLHEWLAQPLFEGLPSDVDERASRLANTADGLASSLRLAGTGTMDPPWWHELAQITAPTAVVSGGLDHKFTALGHRLVDAIGPNATMHQVVGAGHAAHLHDPGSVEQIVRQTLG